MSLILLHRRIFNTLENRSIFLFCLVLPWRSVVCLVLLEATVLFQDCVEDSYVQCQLIFSEGILHYKAFKYTDVRVSVEERGQKHIEEKVKISIKHFTSKGRTGNALVEFTAIP